MQEGNVISYEYRKLNYHEKKYATYDLELASIIHAQKMWRHYLIGRKFKLKTNIVSLKYIFYHPNINSRQERWLTFLSEYEFEIVNIKGKKNLLMP